jgi:hypothetical protein
MKWYLIKITFLAVGLVEDFFLAVLILCVVDNDAPADRLDDTLVEVLDTFVLDLVEVEELFFGVVVNNYVIIFNAINNPYVNILNENDRVVCYVVINNVISSILIDNAFTIINVCKNVFNNHNINKINKVDVGVVVTVVVDVGVVVTVVVEGVVVVQALIS